MATSIPTIEILIGVLNRQKADAVRDRLIDERFKFIAIVHDDDSDFTWVKFEKVCFGSYDYHCIEEVMEGEFFCFSTCVKF